MMSEGRRKKEGREGRRGGRKEGEKGEGGGGEGRKEEEGEAGEGECCYAMPSCAGHYACALPLNDV